jgi:hypothetical protein
MMAAVGVSARIEVADVGDGDEGVPGAPAGSPTDVYGPQAQQVAAGLKGPFDVRTIDASAGRHDAETALRDNKVDVGIVTQSSGKPTALIDGSSLFAAQSAVSALRPGKRPSAPSPPPA